LIHTISLSSGWIRSPNGVTWFMIKSSAWYPVRA